MGTLWISYFILKITGALQRFSLDGDMVRYSLQTMSLDNETLPHRRQPRQPKESAATRDINAGFKKLELDLHPH